MNQKIFSGIKVTPCAYNPSAQSTYLYSSHSSISFAFIMFRNAFRKVLPSNLHTPRSTIIQTKKLSTSQESSAAASNGLAAAVATTFGTYMLADFLSNFLQHPTQKASVVT
jgi:hypothetical protein